MNPARSPHLRILVDYPLPLLASGLAATLGQQSDFEVWTRDDAAACLSPADVVVTDYQRGLSLAQSAAKRRRSRVMVMTMHDREHDVRAAMEAGVDGYLPLACSVDELVVGLRTLGRGDRYVSLQAAQMMADSLMRESLTARETDVLRLVSQGQCNKSIARELDITLGTVKSHLGSIFSKLNCSSRTQAIGIAVQRGLIDEPMRAVRSIPDPEAQLILDTP
jgi:DNA-binding NarL/FixJ family response regulator